MGRRIRARRAGRPWVIREPESGWWAGHPEPSATTFTVAMAGDPEIRWDVDAVVSCLAEVGVHDELLVVYGSPRWSVSGHHALVDGLIDHLPRHHVAAVHIGQHGVRLTRRDVLRLDQLMRDGSLPIVVTPTSAVRDITAKISSGLRADRVLRVHCTAEGAGVHEVWRRTPSSAE